MKSVDIKQFHFSKHPWAREGLITTTAVITSEAKPTRNETSLQVETPPQSKEAVRQLHYSGDRLGPHSAWRAWKGREEGEDQGKSFLSDHLEAAEGGLLGQDVKIKLS